MYLEDSYAAACISVVVIEHSLFVILQQNSIDNTARFMAVMSTAHLATVIKILNCSISEHCQPSCSFYGS